MKNGSIAFPSSILIPLRTRLTVPGIDLLRLYAHPEPFPHTRRFWIAMGCVTSASLLFCSYFIFYLLQRHAAFETNAEDLGIMDQAIWNTLHGHFLQQTVCNIVSDTNCVGASGINRLALHVEPILLPISLLYLIWPHPETLVVLQTVVVGLGAFPAFWLARLRLRSETAGVLIALLYLLYPVQQQATIFDFHAVTLTCTFLLFTFYFLYTRRTRLLFTFALLSMACKEEIPLVIIMLGAWTILFQRRLLVGLVLIALGALWFEVAFKVIMPFFSSTGQPLLIGRYSGVGTSPAQALWTLLSHPSTALHLYVLDPDRLAYLRLLVLPTAGLALLAPWVLVIATPSLLINLLSSKGDMYSGLYQYSAEIVPVLIFASIEGLFVLRWCIKALSQFLEKIRQRDTAKEHYREQVTASQHPLLSGTSLGNMLMGLSLGLALLTTLHYDATFHGQMPFAQDFHWPRQTSHTAIALQIIQKIPPAASISAQTRLVPHLSQRADVYLFPYQDETADYVFLDLTGDVYPFYGSTSYLNTVKHVLQQGNYGIRTARDGYLLLKRNLPPPDAFVCRYMTPKQQQRMGPQLVSLLSEVSQCTSNASSPGAWSGETTSA